MTRINRVSRVLSAVSACVLTQTAAAQSYTEERLSQACVTLQRAPLAPAATQVLLDASRLATNTPPLRSRAMAAYSLTLLMRGNTNAFERAAQIHREAFPGGPELITVDRNAYLAVCGDCEGSGLKQALCPSCMGSGKCTACAGSRVKRTGDGQTAPCPVCKHTGSCAMCAGRQKIETACPSCKGFCRVFKLSDKVRSNYLALLTNMTAICQENAEFAQQFKQAQSERDSAARIQALQALAQRFAHRTDLAPANALLDKAVKERDGRLSEQRKQKEQEQAQRELETLRNLREAEDAAGGIVMLRTYLADHPAAAHKIELQALLNELTDKEARKQTLKKIAYGSLALLIAVMLVQFIKSLLFGKRPTGISTVRNIDKTVFSDPLTLTSAESRAREHSKPENGKPDE